MVNLSLDILFVELKSICRDLASDIVVLGVNSRIVEVIRIVLSCLVYNVEEADTVEPALWSNCRLDAVLGVTDQLVSCVDFATGLVDDLEHLRSLARP